MAFQVREIRATIRFVQGYRYLDRCGAAMVELENGLAEGWIPTEPSPKSGSLKNETLGMTAAFQSELMTVAQSEYISFDHFTEQACKIFDVLWQMFEIKTINVPAMRVVFQKGFEEGEVDKASEYLRSLSLFEPNASLVSLLGGTQSAADFTLVTTNELEWNAQPVSQRRRLQTQVLLQERTPPFDERMMKRVKMLPSGHREAMAALWNLRRNVPKVSPVAAQVEIEHSFETEFSTRGFDLPMFLKESWDWASGVASGISSVKGGKR